MRNSLHLFLAGFLIFTAATQSSRAIPAFARKYKTSCATCHNGFPKLTAFGEAFRRNGYQFPGGADPEFVKEEPVSLGSDGNKKAFPDAIWPGSIPGSSPISIFLNGEMDYDPKNDPRVTFGGLGNSIEAVAAGTLGEDISFWGQFALSSEGTELNRIFLVFSNLIGSSYAFNARVGVFEPGLFAFSTHRAWMEGYWLTTRPFSDYMGWTIEETQKGIELNGMAGGRFGYNAGVVEGFGALHADKDFYGHVTYKIGGLPLDGVTEGGAAPNNPKPYIDNSLTIGAFAYAGTARLGVDSAGVMPDNKFAMFGGDFNAWYENFNLFGGIGIRHDGHPFMNSTGPGGASPSADTKVWFAELDYVLFPWLLPGIRYESWSGQALDAESGSLTSYTDTQLSPGIVFLMRPNVKFTLRQSFAKLFANNDSKMQPGPVSLSMAVGM